MKEHKHIRLLTKTPQVAQSGLSIKLTGTTAIIDRLILAQRQSDWKVVPTPGEAPDGGDGGGDDDGGGLGEL